MFARSADKPWESVDGGPCPKCSRPMGLVWRCGQSGREYWTAPGERMGNKSHRDDQVLKAECPDCGYEEKEGIDGGGWTQCPRCGMGMRYGHPCPRCGWLPRSERYKADHTDCCRRCSAALGSIYRNPDNGWIFWVRPLKGEFAERIGTMCPYCGRTELFETFE